MSLKRCPNGSRKNKNRTCVQYKTKRGRTKSKRCPNGSRKNKNRVCKSMVKLKRCPNGSRKNKNRVCNVYNKRA